VIFLSCFFPLLSSHIHDFGQFIAVELYEGTLGADVVSFDVIFPVPVSFDVAIAPFVTVTQNNCMITIKAMKR